MPKPVTYLRRDVLVPHSMMKTMANAFHIRWILWAIVRYALSIMRAHLHVHDGQIFTFEVILGFLVI